MSLSRTDLQPLEERRRRAGLILSSAISLAVCVAMAAYPSVTAAVVLLAVLPYAWLARSKRSNVSRSRSGSNGLESFGSAFLFSMVAMFAVIDSAAADRWIDPQPPLSTGASEQHED